MGKYSFLRECHWVIPGHPEGAWIRPDGGKTIYDIPDAMAPPGHLAKRLDAPAAEEEILLEPEPPKKAKKKAGD
jgi:hypothetical protein